MVIELIKYGLFQFIWTGSKSILLAQFIVISDIFVDCPSLCSFRLAMPQFPSHEIEFGLVHIAFVKMAQRQFFVHVELPLKIVSDPGPFQAHF